MEMLRAFFVFLLIAPCCSQLILAPCQNGILDEEHNVCMLKAGYRDCHILHKNCVANAYCSERNEVCTCKRGFYQNSDDLCVHGYQETCMTSGDCDRADKELKCGANGKCICPFPEGQYYDPTAKKCIGKYNGNCSAVVGCESNFICKNNTMKCTCPEGLNLTLTKEKCSSGVDKACNQTGDCDLSRFLLCREGHCKCRHPQKEYNNATGMCVGREGELCKKGHSGKDSDYFCAEGTSCKATSGGSEVGRCVSDSDVDWDSFWKELWNMLLYILLFTGMSSLAFVYSKIHSDDQSERDRRAPMRTHPHPIRTHSQLMNDIELALGIRTTAWESGTDESPTARSTPTPTPTSSQEDHL